MSFSKTKITEGVVVEQSGTLTPAAIELTPGGTASTTTTVVGSQTVNRTVTLPNATDTLVGKATTDVLTNKSIDATTNTISNVADANIKAGAAIDATKIAAGTVDNTEFGYLDGVTSAIQTQLDSKAPSTGTVTLTGTQTLTNKSLVDSSTAIVDAGDPTKQIKFDAAGTTATSTTILSSQTVDRTLTLPNATDTLVGKATTDTLTNKTLTSPVINTPTGIVKGDVGLGNVDNTSDATKNSATATLTNKSLDDSTTAIIDTGDATRQIKFDVSGTTSTSTTLLSSQTANRILILPDATDTLVGKATTDTLTNKTIGDALIMTQIATPSTPGAGVNKIYPKSDGNFYTLTSSGVEAPLGSGSGGLKNYLSAVVTSQSATPNTGNGNFELGSTTGWSTSRVNVGTGFPTLGTQSGFDYATGQFIFSVTAANATAGATYTHNTRTFTVVNTISGSTTLVTTGTGAPLTSGTLTKASGTGDATITFSDSQSTTASVNLSISTISSGQLAGKYSGSLVSSGASSAGDMLLSSGFYIDKEDQAKVLTVQFNYNANSGSSNLNFSGTSSNTFAIYIYDVTNAIWIQPAGVYGMTQGSGTGRVSATFQTSSNGIRYQIAVLSLNASAGSFTMYVDDFAVSSSQYVYGSPVTDWQAYTPTFAGFGTVTTLSAFYRRVGANLEGRILFGSGTPTAVTATVTLPSGLSTDTSKLSTSNNNIIGYVAYGAASASTVVILASTTSANTINFGIQSGSAASLNAANGNGITANGTGVSLVFSVPILGWASSLQMSDSADTRVVAAKVTGDPASATAGNPIIWPTASFDTHGAYNTTTGRYTVVVPGIYELTGAFTSATGTSVDLNLYVGAVNTTFAGSYYTTSGRGSFSVSYNANAGDILDIRPSGTLDVQSSGSMTIKRLSGPSAIAATETIAASYYCSTNQNSSTSTPINFDSKEFDTHGAVTVGATWKFTAPASGLYAVSIYNNGTTASMSLAIYKGGSSAKGLAFNNASVAQMNGSTTIRLLAGEFIDIRPSVSSTTTGGALTASTTSNISITRLGL